MMINSFSSRQLGGFLLLLFMLIGISLLPSMIFAQSNMHQLMLPIMMKPAPLLFEHSEIDAGNFLETTDVTSDPDGNIYVLEKVGLIYRVTADNTRTLFLDIRNKVCSDGGEEGLLAMVFHPSYATNNQFYLSYTGTTDDCESQPDTRLRVSQFVVNDERTAGNHDSELMFFEINEDQPDHNGGGMFFHPYDGQLYLGIGDDFALMIAQSSSSFRGKVVRIDVDNPYDSKHGRRDAVVRADIQEVARGFRNPWRMTVDPATGDIYVGDVGLSTWEELNRIPWGASGNAVNFGWPCLEADFNPPNDLIDCPNSSKYTQPIVRFTHVDPFHCSIVVGDVIGDGPRNGGQIIVTDLCAGIIYAVYEDDGWQSQVLGSVNDGDTNYTLADIHLVNKTVLIGGAFSYEPAPILRIQLPDEQ